ncbi:MAG: very short patch repair endonuclease [Pseudomonadota bacterium]|nr:very short patch repair endonuclease [Pseudomonadota bacterium]
MRAVKGENTGPERFVRSALHRLGFRSSIGRPFSRSRTSSNSPGSTGRGSSSRMR